MPRTPTAPNAKRANKRRDSRVKADLPVRADDKLGVARDVSATGMFLDTHVQYRIGRTINLALNLDTPWGKVVFNCRGKIVRLERHDHRVGVAIRFLDKEPRRTVPARKKRRVVRK
jgi:hypothetical protein